VKTLSAVAVLLWLLAGFSMPANAQLLQLMPAAQGDPDILALTAGPERTSELTRFKSTGEKITSKSLPFSALALCADATGIVVAPSDGGLAFLDARMLVKVRTQGLVYESLVCAGSHVYASGRTLRVHRFDFPTLLNRQTVFEANSWVPRLFSPKAGLLAAASWDGSVHLLNLADQARRTIAGKVSLLDLVAAPGDTWITLSDEGQVTTLRDNGTQAQRFKLSGARRLGISPQGVLAVLAGADTVVLYRQAGGRWVEYRRTKPEGVRDCSFLLPLGAGRWAVLSSTGLSFFSDNP